MEEVSEQGNKIKISFLQGKVNKLEKTVERLTRKIEIIERSLKR